MVTLAFGVSGQRPANIRGNNSSHRRMTSEPSQQHDAQFSNVDDLSVPRKTGPNRSNFRNAERQEDERFHVLEMEVPQYDA